MFGLGILKGYIITLRHFAESYWEDLRWRGRRYFRPEGIARRRSKDVRGIFTIQYPEEKLPVPDNFRMLPFLVCTPSEDGTRKPRCTACGTCVRVCPPQCIWIVRAKDPAGGKPLPAPAEFYVDIDRCMNCGYCAEYCPSGAIQMGRDYELASRDRAGHIYNMDMLLKPEARPTPAHPAASAGGRPGRDLSGCRRTGDA
jgi:NADH-quinone oxidoreductase subunit I